MSTITEVRVSADDFELGRLFEAGMGPDAVVKLETLVPVDDDTVPYFRIRTDRLETLLEAVREGSIVDGLRVVDDYGEESLLALDWKADRDRLFGGFREYCDRVGLHPEVIRVYNPPRRGRISRTG